MGDYFSLNIQPVVQTELRIELGQEDPGPDSWSLKLHNLVMDISYTAASFGNTGVVIVPPGESLFNF